MFFVLIKITFSWVERVLLERNTIDALLLSMNFTDLNSAYDNEKYPKNTA